MSYFTITALSTLLARLLVYNSLIWFLVWVYYDYLLYNPLPHNCCYLIVTLQDCPCRLLVCASSFAGV